MNNLYNNNFKACEFGSTLEEYIMNTTIVAGREDVESYIQFYLWKLEKKNIQLDRNVKEVIEYILSDDELLNRTTIVAYSAWRKGVIYLRPNYLSYTNELGHPIEAAKEYKKKEKVFLCLNETLVNMFVQPMALVEETRQNAWKQIEMRNKWKNEYAQIRNEKIDELLDHYNQCKKWYDRFQDEKDLKRCHGILETLKNM